MTLLETITAWQREALSIQPPSGARLSSIVLSECESSPQNLPYRVHDWLESCWEWGTCSSSKFHPAVIRRDGLISENVSYDGFAIFASEAACQTVRWHCSFRMALLSSIVFFELKTGDGDAVSENFKVCNLDQIPE